MTLLGGSSVQASARDLREPRDRPRLWDPDEKDFNNILNPKIILGDTGKGKGVLQAFILTELYDNPPECIGGRPKIVVFDIIGRGEMSCSFSPMRFDNPLFKYISHQANELPDGELETVKEADGTERPGVNPKGYNVEVRMPLAWAFERPALEYLQPAIVKPYVLAIDDQMPSDWVELLGLSEDHRAANLHRKVLEKGTREGWLATATPEKLASEAEAMIGRKKGKGLYTRKQMQTLGNLYDRLGGERLIMPKHPAWDDERGLPWLDMKATLEDVDTITVFPLDFTGGRSQSAHLMAVLLNHIIYLKDKNNRQRVRNAVVVSVPDISIVAAKSFESHEDKYMRLVKEKLLWLFSKGTGNQICIIGDSQDPEDMDNSIIGKGTAVGLFKLERDKIRDIFKNMVVANKEDMLETETLQKLERPGMLIWKSPPNSEAELVFGAIPRFEYPRHKLGAMSDFSYVDLWRLTFPHSSHPDAWHNIAPLYSLVESVRKQSENEREMVRPEEEEGGKAAKPKADFGPGAMPRVKALLEAYPGKGKVVIGVADMAALLERTGTVAAGKPNSAKALAKQALLKMEKRGFAHGEIDNTYGKRWLYTVELGRLRKALEADAQTVILPEYSEAAKKVAELGDRVKLALLDGKKDEALRLVVEMAELARQNEADKDVRAVMIGFMASKMTLPPEAQAALGGA